MTLLVCLALILPFIYLPCHSVLHIRYNRIGLDMIFKEPYSLCDLFSYPTGKKLIPLPDPSQTPFVFSVYLIC